MIEINVIDENGTLKVLGTLYEDYPLVETDLKEFGYDNTVSINLVYDSDGHPVGDLPYNVNIHFYHGIRYIDDYVIEGLKDGLYTFKLLIIPTKEHLECDLGIVDNITYELLRDLLIEAGYHVNFEDTSDFALIAYNTENNQIEQAVFCSSVDPTDHTFWIKWHKVKFENIIDIMPFVENTTMLLAETTFVKYSNLYKCFITQAQNLLSIYSGDKNFCTGNKLCSDLMQKKYSYEIQIRDYLWTAVNVLKYCIELGNYEQAKRIINCVSSCSGICNNEFRNSYNSNGCGCYN